MVLAATGTVEERGSGSQSTSRPWLQQSSEWSGHGWTSHRLWPPLPPLLKLQGAVATDAYPDGALGTTNLIATTQAPTGRLTALTPQNQPEGPC